MVRGKWQSGHCCRTVTAIVGVLFTILLLVPATAQTKNIFWTDRVPRKIQRANLDGTGVEDIVSLSMGEGITIATITSSNCGPGVDGSSSGTDDIRYVPFKSKYILLALVAILGGWLVYRRV